MNSLLFDSKYHHIIILPVLHNGHTDLPWPQLLATRQTTITCATCTHSYSTTTRIQLFPLQCCLSPSRHEECNQISILRNTRIVLESQGLQSLSHAQATSAIINHSITLSHKLYTPKKLCHSKRFLTL